MKFLIRCTHAEVIEAATLEIARRHGLFPELVELEVSKEKRSRKGRVDPGVSPLLVSLRSMDLPFAGTAAELGRALGIDTHPARLGRLLSACSKRADSGIRVVFRGHGRRGSRWEVESA